MLGISSGFILEDAGKILPACAEDAGKITQQIEEQGTLHYCAFGKQDGVIRNLLSMHYFLVETKIQRLRFFFFKARPMYL